MIKYLMLFLLIPKLCFGFSPGMIGTGFTVQQPETETLYPSGGGTYGDWAGGDYTVVNDSDDLTYVSSSTGADRNSYTHTGTSIFSIANVEVFCRAKISSPDATRGFKLFIRSGTTNSDSLNKVLSGSFAEYSQSWVNDPNTGASWTHSGVNNVEFGHFQNYNSIEEQVSDCWLVVNRN